MEEPKNTPVHALDLRHIGRMYDKEMPIDSPGMEAAKPGLPDMRRRKFTVPLPDVPPSPGPDDPPQTDR
jgi:hypothetical protein